MCDERDEELEALRAIYEDHISIAARGVDCIVTTEVLIAEDAEPICVECRLQLQLPPDYPGASPGASLAMLRVDAVLDLKSSVTPPGVTVLDPRGLSDRQHAEIEAALRAEAELLEGCQMVYALVERAKALLAEHETPEGDCCICAEPLAARPYMRTQCYHAFHKDCFAHWHVTKAAEAPPLVDHRAIQREAPAAMPTAPVGSAVPCPICRLSIDASRVLPQVMAELQAVEGSAWLAGGPGDMPGIPRHVLVEAADRKSAMERQAASIQANRKPHTVQ